MTTKRERLAAVLAGERADRLPVALWCHFPVDDQDSRSLAEATLEYQRQFDFDFIKLTPASSYCVKDWGSRDEWRGDPEGTRDYTRYPVDQPGDWRHLRVLSPRRGNLNLHLKCLMYVREAVEDTVPFLATVFSPLSQAKHLAGEDRLLEHLRRDPADVLAGLETITRTSVEFIDAARKLGIAGVFFAVQHASFRIMDRESYARFGEVFDRRVLEAADGLWLNVLHLHGDAVMFDLANTLPIQVVNWHDRETGPSLEQARRLTRAALCGGVGRIDPLVLGEPRQVERQAKQAMGALDGRGLILGTGCVVPQVAPRANILALRRSVDFA